MSETHPATTIPLATLTARFRELIAKTAESVGSTAPNPAVGAAALDENGQVLSLQLHSGAGTPHAEALVIADLRHRGLLTQTRVLLVTLEPCNHTGRTPPCTQAILDAGIPVVFFAAKDPNPRVAGGGAQFLNSHGVRAELFSDAATNEPAGKLIRAFSHWSRTGRPWVTVKQALRTEGSMLPDAGAKTFTSQDSLVLAHELRKRADAVLTGSGTVLADFPEFTVRHVSDHPVRTGPGGAPVRKEIAVLDRRERVKSKAPEWIRSREAAGFHVAIYRGIPEALAILGARGVLEVLVEAGPLLTDAVRSTGLWNEWITIQTFSDGRPDEVRTEIKIDA